MDDEYNEAQICACLLEILNLDEQADTAVINHPLIYPKH